MREDDHPFIWPVSADGYRIVRTRAVGPDAPDREVQFITDGFPIGVRSIGNRLYQPLKEFDGLFLNFQELGMSEERIVDFAERHGMLGPPISVPIPLGVDETGKQLLGVGEPLMTWMMESQAMRQVVQLWEAARKGDFTFLGRHVVWTEHGVHFDSAPEMQGQKPDPPYYRSVAPIGDRPFGQFDPGELIKPALSHVQHVINKHLSNRASPQLLWRETQSRLGLYVVPQGLIGAMWLQFAEAVHRDKHYRECATCGRWFEVAPGAGRPDKQFCSAYCRTKAFRGRQAAAVAGVSKKQAKGGSESKAPAMRKRRTKSRKS